MIWLALAWTTLAGWILLPRRLEAGSLAGPALGFTLGVFAISAEMFLLDVIGAGWPLWLILFPLTAAAGVVAFRRGGLGLRLKLRSSLVGWGAAAVVVPVLLLWAPYERQMPLTSQTWDTWAIWLFKAKAFYLDGAVEPYLERSSEFIGQPGYPLLTPLYSTFLYGLAGEVADQQAKVVTPLFFMATLGLLLYLGRRLARPTVGAICAGLFALTPMAAHVAFFWAGYADTVVAFYMAAAAGFLALWLREGSRLDLTAASLAAAAAAWTKNEGQLFLAGFGLIAAAGLVWRRRPAAEWAILLLPSGLLLGLWAWARASAGVEAAGFVPLVDFEPALFAQALGTMTAKAFSPLSYAFIFPVWIASAAALALWRARPALWVPAALLVWQLLGDLLAYSTGRNDLDWWLGTSADRLLAQLIPLALLSLAAAFGVWFDRLRLKPSAERPLPAAAPAATRSPAAARKRPRR